MKTFLFFFLLSGSIFGQEIVQRGKQLLQELEQEEIHGRIIGGQNVDIFSHNWQVSLQTTRSGHICGAVILSTSSVLTAAHCVKGSTANQLRISVGSDTVSGTIVPVAAIIIHPDYSEVGAEGFPNDIAVLKLSQTLSFSNRVNKIEVSNHGEGTFVGQTCTITGWGRTSGSSSSLPTLLKGANTTVISNSECKTIFTNIAPVGDYHVCVNDPSTSACNGDSGGPLVCTVGSSPVLLGVTSWGISGCPVQYPSVYTRVSYFNQWITQNQ